MPFAESVAETTQVKSPWKAVLRTVVAQIPGIAVLTPAVLDAISGSGDGASLGAWAVGALAVSGAVTRVLALPGVETFLRQFAPWLAAGAKEK